MLDVLKNQGPQVPDSFVQRLRGCRAWRTDAAAFTGASANVIPALCRFAPEIADEMVKRGAERVEDEEDS